MSDKAPSEAKDETPEIHPAATTDTYATTRGSHLPVARVRKMMKEGEHTGMIAADAPVVLAKACEMLVRELTLQSWDCTLTTRRCTLQKQDVASAIYKNKLYYFLFDIFSPEELVPKIESGDIHSRRPFAPMGSPRPLSPTGYHNSPPLPVGGIGTPGSYILPPPVPFPRDTCIPKGPYMMPSSFSPSIKPSHYFASTPQLPGYLEGEMPLPEDDSSSSRELNIKRETPENYVDYTKTTMRPQNIEFQMQKIKEEDNGHPNNGYPYYGVSWPNGPDSNSRYMQGTIG
ncbi:bifunctional Transcription factor CBF-NF-Y-archaeal histone domain/Histone-fold/Transcriptional activator HAP5 subunit [Babesia duncani]|uniref:Bifunctional Transcription factor CBF-NF-Y-archaeal histone domain/Histone-fold/Transcriptional activator HAP5 subunit n=1 Tax=Babesia duncani TaxID=323732 RepID=A0AAD9PMW0_9APIC|nr:bifunctional Transcription factor CBF-NF-Y-archaeal histone domain/Histone-fold/Transcriptional activator HAP5 subunit [Babesia duncani]